MRKYYYQVLLNEKEKPINDAKVDLYLSKSETYAYYSRSENSKFVTSDKIGIYTDENGMFSFWIADKISSPEYGYFNTQRFRLLITRKNKVYLDINDVDFLNVGFSGYSGYSGMRGLSGEYAASGYSGYSGFSGMPGEYAAIGLSGYSGYSGSEGQRGYKGFPGDKGDQGKKGEKGDQGVQGESGYSGYSGWPGIPGTDGKTGKSGYSGFSGWRGWSGYSGYSGFDGISGLSGYSGYSGTSIEIDNLITLNITDVIHESEKGKVKIYSRYVNGIDEYTKLLVRVKDDYIVDVIKNNINLINVKLEDYNTKINEKSIYIKDGYIDLGIDYYLEPKYNDFMFDCWFNIQTSGEKCILSNFSKKSLDIKIIDNKIGYFVSSNGLTWDILEVVGRTEFLYNTWNHLAFGRYRNNWLSFINGIFDIDVISLGEVIDSKETKLIGKNFEGYLDEIRFSYGIARWTNNFIPSMTNYTKTKEVALFALIEEKEMRIF